MALMTAKEYIDSLRKLNTRVYMFGEKIDNWVDHPKFRQVPSRVRIFGAERGAETVSPAERGAGRFHVKLAALRKVGRFVEVGRAEERAGTFAFVRGENRGVDEREIAGVEISANRLDDFVPDGENCVLARAADPQMPQIHQKIRPVLLRGYRIVFRFGNEFDVRSDDFNAARRFGLRNDRSPDPNGTFLCEMLDGFEFRGGNIRGSGDDLYKTRAIAELDEADLSGSADARGPTRKFDFLADKIAQMANVDFLEHDFKIANGNIPNAECKKESSIFMELSKEREKGLGPSTPTLARSCSTN